MPLGYDAKDKKLTINKGEAETVRYIFKRYLELKSFGKLVEDLDNKGIVTKCRNTKVKKFNGGIPFTYGPLAYFLKNRIYVGETGHKEKWFPGEHAAIVDRKIFDQVQQLLASQPAGRKARRTASGALLMGKLYDDRGNRMSPSFSAKTACTTGSMSAQRCCGEGRPTLDRSGASLRQRLRTRSLPPSKLINSRDNPTGHRLPLKTSSASSSPVITS